MELQSKISPQSFHPNSDWFSKIIEEVTQMVRCHELQLDTDTAPEKIKELYTAIKENDIEKIAYQNKLMAQEHFVKQIVRDFAISLSDLDIDKWAVTFNDSKVFAWVVINDDDDETEKNIILTEARINAQYHQYGFDLVSTIVEKSDSIAIPNHYNPIEIIES